MGSKAEAGLLDGGEGVGCKVGWERQGWGWEGGQAGAGVQTKFTDRVRRSQGKGCEGLLRGLPVWAVSSASLSSCHVLVVQGSVTETLGVAEPLTVLQSTALKDAG